MRIILLTLVVCVLADIPLGGDGISAGIEDILRASSKEDIRYQLLRSPERAYVPDSLFKIDVQPPDEPGEKTVIANLVGDGWRRGITCRILREEKREYATLIRAVERGDIVEYDDFTCDKGWVSNKIDFMPEKNMKYRLKSDISQGMPVFEKMLELISSVESQEDVALLWIKGGIQLSTKAKALEDGNLGDRVDVYLNGQRLEGQVIGDGKVLVK